MPPASRSRVPIVVALAATAVGLVALASPLHAQASPVTGIVYDSVARRPLAGATVQLARADSASVARATVSDESGRFTIDALPAGRWLASFVHPVLDSLGLEPTVTPLEVRDGAPTRLALAVPSPLRIHAAVCGASTAATDSTGVVIGHLRDAATQAGLENARVVARWLELVIGPSGTTRSVPALVASSDARGWFAICGVPLGAEVALQAARGEDSTAVVPVEVPATRLLRRDFYLGATELVVTSDADAPASATSDTLRPLTTVQRRGAARLDGVVRRVQGRVPLAGAQVTISGSGVTATTDSAGRFALRGLPPGTQLLVTRALGYMPDERVVDLVEGRTPGVDVSLTTVQHVLDTIRVVGSRVFDSDRSGFERRRRGGRGYYFGPEEIARLRPRYVSELLVGVPRFQTTALGDIVMRRGLSGSLYRRSGTTCSPVLFVDGLRSPMVGTTDLNAWLRTDVIAGIEVYNSPNQVPAEFTSLSDCGTIVVWTKPRDRAREASARQRRKAARRP